MMSQPRMRKAPSVAIGDASRVRGSAGKASGDSAPCNGHAKQHSRTRSRSKNKIPKSIRYDLENALVGLCDVWFEEIKPHLIRNNIKVHVHKGGEGGTSASGDRYRRPPGAPGCSHLDPGAASDERRLRDASCAGCCSTLPTASKAQCRKLRSPASPRLPPVPSLHPQSPHGLSPKTQTPCRNYNDDSEQRSRLRRSKRARSQLQGQPQPPKSNCPVPRLCRTYSILTPNAISRNPRTIRTASTQPQKQAQPRELNHFQFIQPKRKPRTRDKWTQTDKPYPIASRSPTRQSATQTLTASSRTPGKTTLPTKQKGKNQRQPRVACRSPHFPDDLVEIIGEKYDELRILYKSPREEEIPSQMNLLLGPKCPQGKVGGVQRNLAQNIKNYRS